MPDSLVLVLQQSCWSRTSLCHECRRDRHHTLQQHRDLVERERLLARATALHVQQMSAAAR